MRRWLVGGVLPFACVAWSSLAASQYPPQPQAPQPYSPPQPYPPQQQPYPQQPYPPQPPQPPYPAPPPQAQPYAQPQPQPQPYPQQPQPYPPPIPTPYGPTPYGQPIPAPYGQPAPPLQPLAPAPSRYRSGGEMAYLYGVGFAYGVGSGIWIDALAKESDPGIAFIAPLLLGAAVPVAVYAWDYNQEFDRGVPSSIATGLLLGGIEGTAIDGLQWQLSGNDGPHLDDGHLPRGDGRRDRRVPVRRGDPARPSQSRTHLERRRLGRCRGHPLRIGRGRRRLERQGRGLGRYRVQRRHSRRGGGLDGLRPLVADAEIHVAGRRARHPRHDAGVLLLHRERRGASPRAHRERGRRPRGPEPRRGPDRQHDRLTRHGLVGAALSGLGEPEPGRRAGHGLRAVVKKRRGFPSQGSLAGYFRVLRAITCSSPVPRTNQRGPTTMRWCRGWPGPAGPPRQPP